MSHAWPAHVTSESQAFWFVQSMSHAVAAVQSTVPAQLPCPSQRT